VRTLDGEDPARNYAEPATEALGSRCHDVLLRDLLEWALANVARNVRTPEDVLPELFKTHPEHVISQMQDYMQQHRNIPINLHWPREDASLPFVAVVLSTNSNDEVQSLGNEVGTNRRDMQSIYQVGEDVRIDLYVTTLDPNFTILLAELIKRIMWVNSVALEGYHAMRGMTLSMQDVRHSIEYLPKFCYTRVVMVKFGTDFQWSHDERVLRAVCVDFLSRGVYVKRDGTVAP